MAKTRKRRSINRKIAYYFTAVGLFFVVVHFVLYFLYNNERYYEKLVDLSHSCRSILKDYVSDTRNLIRDESRYKQKLHSNLRNFSRTLNELFKISETRVPFTENPDSVIAENLKFQLDLEETILRDIRDKWVQIKLNITLVTEEPTFEDSSYTETIHLPEGESLYDSTTNTIVTTYIRKRHKKVINRSIRPLLEYDGLQTSFLFKSFDEVIVYYQEKRDEAAADFFLWLIIFLVLSTALIVLSYFYIFKLLIKPLRKMVPSSAMAKAGKIRAMDLSTNSVEFGTFKDGYNKLVSDINKATEFVSGIKKGNLDETVKISDNGSSSDLIKELESMRTQLLDVNKLEKERTWEVEGQAKFASLLQQHAGDFDKMTDEIIANMVNYLGATQGGLFVVHSDGEEDDKYLSLVASFAYDRKKYVTKRVDIGEGLVGQAWQEKGTIHIKHLPEDHMVIKSGLGDAGPENLLIVPLLDADQVYGVLEIASFQEIPKYQVSFAEKIGTSIASAMLTAEMNRKTQQLLENSQDLAEKLMVQEESMRQNLEEMTATQESMEREMREKESALLDEINALQKKIERSQAIEKKMTQELVSAKKGKSNPATEKENIKLKQDTVSLQEELKDLQTKFNATIQDLEEKIRIKDLKIERLSKD